MDLLKNLHNLNPSNIVQSFTFLFYWKSEWIGSWMENYVPVILAMLSDGKAQGGHGQSESRLCESSGIIK